LKVWRWRSRKWGRRCFFIKKFY